MDHPPLNSPVFKAGRQSDADPYDFVLSTESVDRVGDVIRADGWDLTEFKRNPIALFGHMHDKVIGIWKNVRVEGKQLLGRLHLAEPGTSELVDTTRKLIEQRILKAVSVGFMPIDGKPRDKNDPYGGWEYTQSALHEVSVVAVPANPEALSMAKALCSEECADILFVRPDAADDAALAINGRPAEILKTPNIDRFKQRFAHLGID